MKAPKPAKKTTENRAWAVFAKYIRLRDAIATTGGTLFCVCCTCQRRKPFADFDAGHFISRKAKSILFDEKNVHGQCRTCNRDGDGEPKAYRYFLLIKYGQAEIDRLEYHKKRLKQWKSFELEAIVKEYEEKIKGL